MPGVAGLSCAHYLRLGPGFNRGRARDAAVADLPLEVVDATGGASSDLMAIIITGDGGWTAINQRIARRLARRGAPTVGLISPRYFFWRPRTPESAARDVARIIDHYTNKWGKRGVILIGYSRGADVLPFIVNRLPEASRGKIAELALLGLEPMVAFEIGVRDYLGGLVNVPNERPVLPEVERLEVRKVVCIYGTGERNSLCARLGGGRTARVKTIGFPGGHHFGGAYESIAERLLEEAQVYMK